MPKITKIESQKNNKSRYNVYLDGKYAFSLNENVIVEKKLKVGNVLSETVLNDIDEFDKKNTIYFKVLNYLSFRPRSISEINSKITLLAKKELFDEEEIPKIIEDISQKLKKINLYGDTTLASQYIESSKNSQIPLGSKKIESFLLQKGVGKHLIMSLLSDYAEYEKKGALEEFKKKVRKLGVKENIDFKDKAKISKYLANKGYSWDAINTVVDSDFEL